MKIIKAQLKIYDQKNDQARRDPDAQSKGIDQCIIPVSYKASEGDRKEILKHSWQDKWMSEIFIQESNQMRNLSNRSKKRLE